MTTGLKAASFDHARLAHILASLNSRPCGFSGCREVSSERFCETHRKQKRPHSGQDPRPSAAKRGYDRHHQRMRLLVLHRDPVCKWCGVEFSTVADHIAPLRSGGTWSMENMQGLCGSCHAKKTRQDNS